MQESIIYIYKPETLHHKNQVGVHLLKEFMNIVFINNISQITEPKNNVLISPAEIISSIPDLLVICGPQISFDTSCLRHGASGNIINMLSHWNAEGACKFNGNYKKENNIYWSDSKVTFVCMPFPVDYKRFVPSEKKDFVMIYYKHVERERLNNVKKVLDELQISYQIFEYGSYNESNYLQALGQAKAIIWLGCHESQGFAFEEALSCDTPILVFDVDRLFDECINGWRPWGSPPFNEVKATAASYWDDNCGMVVKYHSDMDFKGIISNFLSNIHTYHPRKFVQENLTAEIVAKKWKETFKHLRDNK